jgi:hypothetical protein
MATERNGPMRRFTSLAPLAAFALSLLLLAPAALAQGAGMEAKPAPGPAKKIKVTEFVSLEQLSVVKFQFLDAKGTAVKAPAEAADVTWTSNITNPRSGKFTMKDMRWSEEDEAFAYGKLPARGSTCPGRTMTMRVSVKVGKATMSDTLTQKITCTRK